MSTKHPGAVLLFYWLRNALGKPSAVALAIVRRTDPRRTECKSNAFSPEDRAD